MKTTKIHFFRHKKNPELTVVSPGWGSIVQRHAALRTVLVESVASSGPGAAVGAAQLGIEPNGNGQINQKNDGGSTLIAGGNKK